MIYIHRKPYGRAKRLVTTVYTDEKRAREDYELLGGELIECVDVCDLERIKEIVVDEVACLIDDMSTGAPGSARELKPGSSEWDLYKIGALNKIRELLSEI